MCSNFIKYTQTDRQAALEKRDLIDGVQEVVVVREVVADWLPEHGDVVDLVLVGHDPCVLGPSVFPGARVETVPGVVVVHDVDSLPGLSNLFDASSVEDAQTVSKIDFSPSDAYRHERTGRIIRSLRQATTPL